MVKKILAVLAIVAVSVIIVATVLFVAGFWFLRMTVTSDTLQWPDRDDYLEEGGNDDRSRNNS